MACLVPGCRCTVAKSDLDCEDNEAICTRHWRSIPLRERRAYSRRRKIMFEKRDRGSISACWRLWSWLRRMAIEKAMGI